MSDNPYQNDRGNKDASITRPGKPSEIDSTKRSGPMTEAPGGPYLIGDTMTGGYGKGPDILHDCTIAVDKGEIAVIEGYLPKQMSREEIETVCAEVRDELDASGLKDMGRCMGVVKERYTGQLDMGEASKIMKSALS